MYKFDRAGEVIKTYWGAIQTLVSTPDYVMKRIWMLPDTQSSLEYHVKKTETYYIEQGPLIVGLREGRDIYNTTVRLEAGQIFTIYPGQMHMRIAPGDVTMLEVSTGTYIDVGCPDTDTFFVEDGKTYTHAIGGEK